jgi:hypothetical protein
MLNLYTGQFEPTRRFNIIALPERHDGEYRDVQIAVEDRVCVPFSIPAYYRDLFATEEEWVRMLVRQAVALIEQYGDSRLPFAWQQKGGDA